MIADTAHRPWPLPPGPWVMAQSWHDLLFAHWPVPPDRLRAMVPSSLSLDTFDGQTWVGVVPFHMSGIHLRGLPPLPGLSAFPELNVRTYVTAEGKPGVWFLSLDAANHAAVATARRWYHLPYYHAHMSVAGSARQIAYSSRRVHRGARPAEFHGRYGPTGTVFLSRPGSLDHWLTERYCLYAVDAHRRLYRGEIHHAPWPVQPAEAEIARNTMALAQEITLPQSPPLLHFARRLDVVVWRLQRVPE